MWLLMLASAALFAYYGLQLRYEENILKLLPQTEGSAAYEPVFGNLKVKDKVFIQIAPKGFTAEDVGKTPVLDAETLSLLCDEFVDSLTACDGGRYVAGVLSCLDDDTMMSALDYLIAEFPTFVPEECYSSFDSLLSLRSIRAQMARNAELLKSDVDGNLAMLVSYDPVGLRYGMLPELRKALSGSPDGVSSSEAVKDGSESGRETGTGLTFKNRHLFSKDGNVVLAFVAPAFDYMDSSASADFVKMIEERIDAFEARHP